MDRITIYNKELNQLEELNPARITDRVGNRDTKGNEISVTYYLDNYSHADTQVAGHFITVGVEDARKIDEARGVKAEEKAPPA